MFLAKFSEQIMCPITRVPHNKIEHNATDQMCGHPAANTTKLFSNIPQR